MATVMLRMESLQRSEIRGQRSGVRDQFKRRSPDFLYCATTEGNYRQPPAVGPIARYSLAQGVSRVSKPRHGPPSFMSQTWATRHLRWGQSLAIRSHRGSPVSQNRDMSHPAL
jgi:hypothetical protein